MKYKVKRNALAWYMLESEGNYRTTRTIREVIVDDTTMDCEIVNAFLYVYTPATHKKYGDIRGWAIGIGNIEPYESK